MLSIWVATCLMVFDFPRTWSRADSISWMACKTFVTIPATAEMVPIASACEGISSQHTCFEEIWQGFIVTIFELLHG